MKAKIIGGTLVTVGMIVTFIGGSMLDSGSLNIAALVCVVGAGLLGSGAKMIQRYRW